MRVELAAIVALITLVAAPGSAQQASPGTREATSADGAIRIVGSNAEHKIYQVEDKGESFSVVYTSSTDKSFICTITVGRNSKSITNAAASEMTREISKSIRAALLASRATDIRTDYLTRDGFERAVVTGRKPTSYETIERYIRPFGSSYFDVSRVCSGKSAGTSGGYIDSNFDETFDFSKAPVIDASRLQSLPVHAKFVPNANLLSLWSGAVTIRGGPSTFITEVRSDGGTVVVVFRPLQQQSETDELCALGITIRPDPGKGKLEPNKLTQTDHNRLAEDSAKERVVALRTTAGRVSDITLTKSGAVNIYAWDSTDHAGTNTLSLIQIAQPHPGGRSILMQRDIIGKSATNKGPFFANCKAAIDMKSSLWLN